MQIIVSIQSMDDFFNPFNNQELNPSLGEYILNKAMASKMYGKNKLEIVLKPDFKTTSLDRNEMVDVIKSYYRHESRTNKEYLQNTKIKYILFALIGLLLIAGSYIFENISKFLLPEIFLIIGWGCIWEVTYGIFFYNSKTKYRNRLMKRLSTCNIVIEEQK